MVIMDAKSQLKSTRLSIQEISDSLNLPTHRSSANTLNDMLHESIGL